MAGTITPPVVPPGTAFTPSSPGFVFGGVGVKTAGFWLTSEGIPSNVAGVPVLFGDGEVIFAAVGTEAEADYTIGIYQHQGNEVGLNFLGQFSITSGGVKRVALTLPIDYSSPDNIQLACKILSGTTNNLKVSLVLRGTDV